MKRLTFCYLLVLLFSFNTPAQESDEDLKFANNMLITAKMAGVCGTLKQIHDFQDSTQMQGGDEFLDRFMKTELARLGTTMPEFAKICTDSINTYNDLKKLSQ